MNKKVFFLLSCFCLNLFAEQPAVSGTVQSAEEGVMAGVLISLKKQGTTITVTVPSNKQGQFQFPVSRISAGTYAVTIRATGWDLIEPKMLVLEKDKVGTLNIRLKKTLDLAAQMTNGDWLESFNGNPMQKRWMLDCVHCHSLERIARSTHDSESFSNVMIRMQAWGPQSSDVKPVKRMLRSPPKKENETYIRSIWMSSLNLRNGKWNYPLKVLPRPKGRSIITQYDLSRPNAMPHDAEVAADGKVWYQDFTELIFGELDPVTGLTKEYNIPVQKTHVPIATLSVRLDKAQNVWMGMMNQGAVARFEPKTQKLDVFPLPAELNDDMTQMNQIAVSNSHVDGKVWVQDHGMNAVHRLDPATKKWETWQPLKWIPGRHYLYDVISDSKNNVYFTDWYQDTIGRIDAITGKSTLFSTPTAFSGPRRGSMDSQDRFWYGAYYGNRIGMFDTKTLSFKEWTPPFPWFAPYDAVADKNGDVWTASMVTDTVLRLNPKTGKFTEYMLPGVTNVRRVFVDDSTTPPTFWVGSNYGAAIIKLEPQD